MLTGRSTFPISAIELGRATGATGAADFINRELHMKLRQKQEKSLVRAMIAPQAWLEEREKKWPQIEADVAAEFGQAVNKYYQAGYTYEESREKALRNAQLKLDIALEDLEIEYPGANTIFKSAMNTKVYRDNRFALANGLEENESGAGVGLSREQIKEIVRNEKARKRAKRGEI